MNQLEIGLESSTHIFRNGLVQSRFLVIINKGPGAVQIPREEGHWDLMEIYFAKNDIASIIDKPEKYNADYIVFENDRNKRKFAIIKQVFENNPGLWAYEAVIMLDDDLLPVGCSVADIFSAFINTNLRIGQPALTRDSYWSHKIVLQNNKYIWRRTNFVEVMCPIMTRAALKDYLPVFDETISGFGLDVYWSANEWKLYGGVAILDATPLRHTRPVRGGVAYQGISPGKERYEFFRKYELSNFRHLTLAGTSNENISFINKIPIGYVSQFSDIFRFKIYKIYYRINFILLFVLALFIKLIHIFTNKCSGKKLDKKT